ncbi:hypothetical protein [Acinetobacter rudis]|uniref:hypothetical protein n=1 Tax=Acinetobacter rudis TaxID=632955 RepID=UPI003341733A
MFFKTDNPEALKAFHQFNTDRVNLRAAADQFAKEYDAEAVILGDATDVRFGGINFNNNFNINRDIWCKPNRQFGTSVLRVKPLKKELQAEFDAEKEKWEKLHKKHFPNGTRVRKSDFYRTLGFDWGDLFFSSFACFEHNGFIYMDTCISKITNSVEILGSEYLAAQAEHKNKDKVEA